MFDRAPRDGLAAAVAVRRRLTSEPEPDFIVTDWLFVRSAANWISVDHDSR